MDQKVEKLSSDLEKLSIREKRKKSQFVRFSPWLKASATVEQGNVRKTMEDRILIGHFEYRNRQYYYMMIYDGHNGSVACDYAKDHFTEIFGHFVITYRGHQTRKIIHNTFLEINRRIGNENSGTTASLLLLIDNSNTTRKDKNLEMWVANVGDSTIFGVAQKQQHDLVRKLSMDHNVKYESERKRISNVPEYKIEDGYVVLKSGHGLAMSRALGDADFGPHILAAPTIKHIKTPYSTILIGSDGVWDYVNAKVLWQRLNNSKEKRAWKDSAYRLNSWRNQEYPQHDNTSLIVVYIDHEKYSNPQKAKKVKEEIVSNPITSKFLKINPKTN